MPSAAAETTRKPREGKKGLSNMIFLLLDALWNDARIVARPAANRNSTMEPLYHFKKIDTPTQPKWKARNNERKPIRDRQGVPMDLLAHQRS
jgi:hypothetical protein